MTFGGNLIINGTSVFNDNVTFNGQTSFKARFIVNNSEDGSTIRFGSLKTSDDEANLRGKIRYLFKEDPKDSLVNKSQFIFEQNSYNSTV